MELLEGGSLQELMRETDSVIDEATIAWVMREMLQVQIKRPRLQRRDLQLCLRAHA